MKHLFYLLIFLFSSEIIAQEYTISGTVVDEENNAIPYANVVLHESVAQNIEGSSGISGNNRKGAVTDENGYFEFTNLKEYGYFIMSSYIGYKSKKTLYPIQLSKDEYLKIILIEDTQALEEVSLTSNKPTLKKEVDRLVFNVANTSLSEGSILDVLRSTPGVLILENTITVKNGSPTVYINDRKVNLTATEITQLLENSPANTIQKIEVITNPPAKYDAGSGAVLNIVMSKNLITGYRGNVFSNFTQGVFSRYNTGINQFYKTKKINLNLNYSFTKNKINRVKDNTINYLDNSGNLDQKWQTNNNRNSRTKAHNINLNFDYLIDDSNTLSLSSNALLTPYYRYRIHGQTDVTNSLNESLYSFNANNYSQDEKHNLGFDLDFIHRFENKSKLVFNTHFTDYNYYRHQDVNSTYFFTNNTNNFSTAFLTDNNQNTNILAFKMDYEQPVDDSTELAFGTKWSTINTNSDITQFDIN